MIRSPHCPHQTSNNQQDPCRRAYIDMLPLAPSLISFYYLIYFASSIPTPLTTVRIILYHKNQNQNETESPPFITPRSGHAIAKLGHFFSIFSCVHCTCRRSGRCRVRQALHTAISQTARFKVTSIVSKVNGNNGHTKPPLRETFCNQSFFLSSSRCHSSV